MIILPAIDLLDGQVVRLREGKLADKTVYSDDPLAFARRWEEEGGNCLHVVDLNAAFTGEPRNIEMIKRLVRTLNIPVQVGGGIRSLEAATHLYQGRRGEGRARDRRGGQPNFPREPGQPLRRRQNSGQRRCARRSRGGPRMDRGHFDQRARFHSHGREAGCRNDYFYGYRHGRNVDRTQLSRCWRKFSTAPIAISSRAEASRLSNKSSSSLRCRAFTV